MCSSPGKVPVKLPQMEQLADSVTYRGARGLGNHMARALAEAGAKALVIFDSNQALGDEAAEELHSKTGLPVTFFMVDVTDEHAISAAVDSTVELYGAPDVLVNSAGIAE